jgi:hypothetical protein
MSIDTLANKEFISRRKFLQGLGLLSAYPILSTMDSLVGDANAQSYRMPSDNESRQLMTQPVEQTLATLNGGYVTLNDNNYQTQVFQTNTPASQRQPMMVLFHTDGEPSRGNTALIKAINQNFPQIKVGAYRMVRGNIVPYNESQRLKKTYGLRDVPAILFYKNENGNINYLAQMSGGINTLNLLKEKIDFYNKNIPIKFLN